MIMSEHMLRSSISFLKRLLCKSQFHRQWSILFLSAVGMTLVKKWTVKISENNIQFKRFSKTPLSLALSLSHTHTITHIHLHTVPTCQETQILKPTERFLMAFITFFLSFSCMYMRTRTHTHTCARTHTHTHHTHTHTTHTFIHTHTHTQTHTPIPGKRHSHPPSTREIFGGPLHHFASEPKTSEDPPSSGLSCISSNSIQLFIHLWYRSTAFSSSYTCDTSSYTCDTDQQHSVLHTPVTPLHTPVIQINSIQLFIHLWHLFIHLWHLCIHLWHRPIPFSSSYTWHLFIHLWYRPHLSTWGDPQSTK